MSIKSALLQAARQARLLLDRESLSPPCGERVAEGRVRGTGCERPPHPSPLPPENRGARECSAAGVLRFLQDQVGPDGSLPDRSGKPDLYYTVFGLMALEALGSPLPPAVFAKYLPSFGNGDALDFIHLGCLARCWSMRPDGPPISVKNAVLARLEEFRAADGGYAPDPGQPAGTAYAAFLALATYEDLGSEGVPSLPGPWVPLAACPPVPSEQHTGGQAASGTLASLPPHGGERDTMDRFVASLDSLRTADGGYTNEVSLPFASVPATSAAATILSALGRPVPPEAAAWLIECAAPEGGFYAAPGIPMPDLLSTATALHAIRAAGAAVDEQTRAACLRFVRSLAADGGGFRGHSVDAQPDCEYTFYALLALGHLSPR